MMTLHPNEFATVWEAGWNSHDLERILAHYADDVVFRSRKATGLVGLGEIAGKAQLADYWARALAQQPDLSFRVEDVFSGHEMLVISYVNHRGVHAAETLCFGPDGLVHWAAACHKDTL